MEKLGSWFVSRGRMTPEQLTEVMERIYCSADPQDAANDADFISESLPEDPELKAQAFAMFNELCPERTIFTTNTSTLVPSMFADKTGRPEKFAAFHFHDVRISSVVDVMPHPGTAPEVVELVRDFAKSMGQIVIMLHRENNGYVFNTMFSSFLNAALTLAANGVASIEDIDRSWMGVMHTPIGPFGIMDQVGLSTVLTVTEYWGEHDNDPQRKANADFLRQYVSKNLLGFKTGHGFYSYPNPAYAAPGFLAGQQVDHKSRD
jgi:3-hydroxybutyryl-CoA dehydrogenase